MNRIIPFSPPDITEDDIKAVEAVLRSGWITTGPQTKAFEKELSIYCNAGGCAALSSATAALESTLRILGIGEGDEVITTAYTYTATAAVINHVGAKIVMIDNSPGSYFIDYDKIAGAVTPKTKAVIAVDFAGVIADYDKIISILNSCGSRFIPNNKIQSAIGRPAVIADAAHSLGAVRNGKISGEHADFTCFSFHAVKNLTTAEGGAAVWNKSLPLSSDEIYRKYMLTSLHGQTKDALSKSRAGAWEYDIDICGYKCNMTDIAAALGRKQLERYDSILKKRHRIAKIYSERLCESFTVMPHFGEDFSSSAHLFITAVNGSDRNKIIEQLSALGIASNVHYKPLPMLTAYKALGFDVNDFPNAYKMFENELTLPLNTVMSFDDAEYVAECCNKVIK